MWDIRQALINKYNGQYPVGNKGLQRQCSEGNQDDAAPSAPRPAQFCPGNRRYIQLLIDAYLLQPPASSMLTARDAYLAADVMRFNGANRALLNKVFASHGFGEFADTAGTEDDQPTPDYTSPFANEGTLRLSSNEYTSAGRGPAVPGTLYLGNYEARVTPVADTDNSTQLPRTLRLVPGTYRFLFQADGYGFTRFRATIGAGEVVDKNVHLATNLASVSSGASVDNASPGSINTTRLIDDTEASNWAATNPAGVSVDAVNPFVNVDLAGNDPVPVRSVKVSAMLRPADPAQDEDPNMPDEDSGSRFTALRDFAIATCTQSVTSDCSSSLPADTPGSPYTTIYDSTDGKTAGQAAFDSTLPRPLAPDLLLKQFDVPDTAATHVRLTALENQCSGTPQYAGEQDNDPLNATDCKQASSRDESVRAAELQVYSFDSGTRPPGDPVVAMTMKAPASVQAGSRIVYDLTYTNLGPKPSENAAITDSLPDGLRFVSASDGGTFRSGSRTVLWDRGTVAVNVTDSVRLVTKVPATAAPGSVLLNSAQFAGDLTFSPPAAAVTTVSPPVG